MFMAIKQKPTKLKISIYLSASIFNPPGFRIFFIFVTFVIEWIVRGGGSDSNKSGGCRNIVMMMMMIVVEA